MAPICAGGIAAGTGAGSDGCIVSRLGSEDAVLAALCGDRPPASLLALRHQLVVAGADSRVLVPYLARCRDMSPDELAGQFQRVVDLVYADRDPVGLLNLLTSPAA